MVKVASLQSHNSSNQPSHNTPAHRLKSIRGALIIYSRLRSASSVSLGLVRAVAAADDSGVASGAGLSGHAPSRGGRGSGNVGVDVDTDGFAEPNSGLEGGLIVLGTASILHTGANGVDEGIVPADAGNVGHFAAAHGDFAKGFANAFLSTLRSRKLRVDNSTGEDGNDSNGELHFGVRD